MKRNFVIEYFDVVLFMNKSKEERKGKKETKTRKQKKAKRKDGKEERNEEERDRERAIEKGGGPKKAKEKQRETIKNKQKMPFSRGKTVFWIEAKKGKEKKTKQENTNKKMEGLGPSEVALRATSPDP